MPNRRAVTSISSYDEQNIYIRDKNLCQDLIGKVSLTDYLYYLTLGQEPTEGQRLIAEAAIITLAEHGFTPSVIAARQTYMGAPESFQGAVAAGILGVGDQFVGTVELVAPLLLEMIEHPDGTEAAADAIVERYAARKALVPGFGQPHHKPDDPRSPALFAVAERAGVEGTFVAALKVLGTAVDRAMGRHLTINAPAAAAALFLEIGIPPRIMRGFLVISRCIGLVAHLAEEQERPTGRTLWEAAEHAVEFQPR